MVDVGNSPLTSAIRNPPSYISLVSFPDELLRFLKLLLRHSSLK